MYVLVILFLVSAHKHIVPNLNVWRVRITKLTVHAIWRINESILNDINADIDERSIQIFVANVDTIRSETVADSVVDKVLFFHLSSAIFADG